MQEPSPFAPEKRSRPARAAASSSALPAPRCPECQGYLAVDEIAHWSTQRWEFDPQRARGQPETVGERHHAAEAHARERERKALPQPVEVDVVAVIARDHRKAGETAFRGLGGEYHRQLLAAGEVYLLRHLHVRRPTA